MDNGFYSLDMILATAMFEKLAAGFDLPAAVRLAFLGHEIENENNG
jgi:hypothetical protein